jgi:hypothetical protein
VDLADELPVLGRARGVQGHRLLQLLYRLVVLPRLDQPVRQVADARRVVGLELDGLAQRLERLGGPARVEQAPRPALPAHPLGRSSATASSNASAASPKRPCVISASPSACQAFAAA